MLKYRDLLVLADQNAYVLVFGNHLKGGRIESAPEVLLKEGIRGIESTSFLAADQPDRVFLRLDYKAVAHQLRPVKLSLALAVCDTDNELLLRTCRCVRNDRKLGAGDLFDIALQLTCRLDLKFCGIFTVYDHIIGYTVLNNIKIGNKYLFGFGFGLCFCLRCSRFRIRRYIAAVICGT